MCRPTSRPLVPVLVLSLVLPCLSPPSAGAASWWEQGQASSLFGRLWHSLSAVWGQEGCIMDPNGGCRERSSGAPVEGRSQITENGGCIMDPDGRCGSSVSAEGSSSLLHGGSQR